MAAVRERTYIKGGRVGSVSGGLTANQKMLFGLAAVLVGPSILKKMYDKPSDVDLSSFNIVTHYDVPAIQKMDDTLRVEFCASCQSGGQFRRTATALQQQFPALKIEGGPYTPPPSVQYGIRAIRCAQAGVAITFFLGEQLFGMAGRPAPPFVHQMHENKFVTAAGVYGLDVVAQTLKAINAFEITYNGQVLHSKLKSGRFPEPSEVIAKLNAVVQEVPQQQEPQQASA